MEKAKKSGSAVFMDIVIYLALATSIVCFVLYYSGVTKSGVVLWVGITFFTILYHFWLRIAFGNLTKRLPINPNHWWFKEKGFEKKLYKILKVKKWKGKALTYEPHLYSLENRTLDQIHFTMCKSETDHWINEIISLTTLLFPLLWGEMWIFLSTAILAMLFDAQFIVIQRYNRPRVKKLIKREQRKKVNA